MHLNNLIIAFIICILALPGCASGNGKSKAVHEASLDRVNDESHNKRVALLFTGLRAFEEGVLFDRERDSMDETVIRLYCADMVPEYVTVMCTWYDEDRQMSLTGPVSELKDDPFVYEISQTAITMHVIYNDGNSFVKRSFTVDDGELTLEPIEVAANFRH